MNGNNQIEAVDPHSVEMVKSRYQTLLKTIGSLGFIVVAGLLTATTTAACVLPAGQKTKEAFDEFKVSEPVNLSVDVFAGSVVLKGIDGATNIQVAATIHDPDQVRYRVQKRGDTVQVIAKQKRTGLRFRKDKSIGKVDLQVTIPIHANTNVRTNFGNIETYQVVGDSELRTIAGDILIADSQGEFILETEFGGINAQRITGEFELRTATGEISVADSQGEFDLETEFGGISASRLTGESELRTTTGDISIADSQGEFDLETEFGGISAHQVSGEFELSTTAGDISVIGSYGEFNLETELGGISFEGEFTDQSDNSFSTGIGNIEVALGKEPNVELQASTETLGQIHLGDSLARSVSEIGNSDGKRDLKVILGSGNADLSLETQSGSIKIE